MKKRLISLLVSCLVLCTTWALAAPSSAGAAEGQPVSAVPAGPSAPVYGDYHEPILQSAGPDGVRHIDVSATIAKLVGAHITTYAYVISKSVPAAWADLPGFADAAQDAGISLLVYLAPPTETSASTTVPAAQRTPDYPPYQWNYDAWATAIANLAAQHTNIRGIVMDDFGGNTVEKHSAYSFAFSVEYVRTMMDNARAIAPWLTFSPIVYYNDTRGNDAISSIYRSVIDGVVFPYRGESVGPANTHDSSAALSEGEDVGGLVKCDQGARCEQLGFPSDDDIPAGDSVGVSQAVDVSSTGDQTLSYDINDDAQSTCHSGAGCLHVAFPLNTKSTAGQYGGVSQQIAVEPTATHELSFWVKNDSHKLLGYHMLQVLLDGQVVAQQDIGTPGSAQWTQLTANVSSELAGKTSVTLTIRLYEEQGVTNFNANSWVDDASITGATIADADFDDASATSWTTVENTPNFTVSANVPYVIDTLVNGHVVDTRTIGGERGWHTVTVNVPASVLVTPTAVISLRLRATSSVSNQHLAVWLDNVTFSGGTAADPGFELSTATPWEVVKEGADGQAANVRSLQFLFMTYAIYLSAEGQSDPGYYVTADYVQTVVSDAMQLTEEGVADGSLVYKLILTGQPGRGYDPDSYNQVAEVYGDYQASHQPAQCDQLITGAHNGSVVISSGTTCIEKAAVSGSVVVRTGARLIVDATDIAGSIVASNASNVDVCGTHVHNSIVARGSATTGLGDPSRRCVPNLIDGSVVVGNTSASAVITGNIIGGSVVVHANHGESVVSGNHVSGSLVCSGNSPVPTDNDTQNSVDGAKARQCVAL